MALLPLAFKKKAHALTKRAKLVAIGTGVLLGGMMTATLSYTILYSPAGTAVRAQEKQRLEKAVEDLVPQRDAYLETLALANALDTAPAEKFGVTGDSTAVWKETARLRQSYAAAVEKTAVGLVHNGALSSHEISQLGRKLWRETPAEEKPQFISALFTSKEAGMFLRSCRNAAMAKPGSVPGPATAKAIVDCSYNVNTVTLTATFMTLAGLAAFAMGAGILRRRWDKTLPQEEAAALAAAAIAKAAENEAVTSSIHTGTQQAIKVKPIKIAIKPAV